MQIQTPKTQRTTEYRSKNQRDSTIEAGNKSQKRKSETVTQWERNNKERKWQNKREQRTYDIRRQPPQKEQEQYNRGSEDNRDYRQRRHDDFRDHTQIGQGGIQKS